MASENQEVTSISAQAMRWRVLFQDGNASAADKLEFVEWATCAPEHVKACLELAQVQSTLAKAEINWPQLTAQELICDAKAASEETVVPLYPRAVPMPARTRRPVVSLAYGLAAVLLAAICLDWLLLSRPDEFQTKIGEQRSVLLADGSRVTLNTASNIIVRLSSDRRDIDLVKGEALFEVAHDAQRPFDVHVGNTIVRAVGTQFDINRLATQTVVTVVDGRVTAIADGVRTEQPLVLSAADRLVLNGSGSKKLQHEVDLSEAVAWTKRQLVFHRRPLGEVADEFNRYSVAQIEIRSPALRAQQVTGTFRSDSIASFIKILRSVPGVHVEDDGAGRYVVTSGESPAAQK